MPGITKEQRIAFIQKYDGMFDEEVLVDQGAFKGCKVKEADRQFVENYGQKSCLEWLLDSIASREPLDSEISFGEYLKDKKYTFLAIRHHFNCEGSLIVERSTQKILPEPTVYTAWKNYARSHGYSL